MALSQQDAIVGPQGTRENYLLPALNTSVFSRNDITFLGNDFDQFQGVKINLSGKTFTMTRATATAYAAVKLFDLDKGNYLLANGVITGAVTMGANSGATEPLLAALGTAATADATLSGNEVNVIAQGTTGATVSRVGALSVGKTAVSVHDLMSAGGTVYLNLAQAANVSTGDTSVTFGSNAYVTLYYNCTRPYNA